MPDSLVLQSKFNPVEVEWMLEQTSVEATRALTGVFALSGDPFMLFVGGEVGIEDDLVAISRLRDARPELAEGISDYDAVRVDQDGVYAVTRRSGSAATLVLVNLGAEPSQVTGAIPADLLNGGTDAAPFTLSDLYGAESLTAVADSSGGRLQVDMQPYQVRVLALS